MYKLINPIVGIYMLIIGPVFKPTGSNYEKIPFFVQLSQDSTLSSAVNLLQGRATEMNAERLEEKRCEPNEIPMEFSISMKN